MGSCDQAHSIVQLLWTNKRNYLHFLSFNQVSMITILALRTALKKTTAKMSQGSDEFYLQRLFSIILTDRAIRNSSYKDNHQKVYVVHVMGSPDTSANPRHQIKSTRTTPQCLTNISEFSAYTLWRDPGEGKGDLFQGGNRRAWTATPGNLFTCTEKEHSPYAQGLIFEVSQYI